MLLHGSEDGALAGVGDIILMLLQTSEDASAAGLNAGAESLDVCGAGGAGIGCLSMKRIGSKDGASERCATDQDRTKGLEHDDLPREVNRIFQFAGPATGEYTTEGSTRYLFRIRSYGDYLVVPTAPLPRPEAMTCLI